MAKKPGKKGKHPPPLIKNDVLLIWDFEIDKKIARYNIGKPRNWKYWMQFLETEKSFRYESTVADKTISFTGVKEIRSGSARKPRPPREYWYAHKRIGGQLHRKYLGYAESLTTVKLLETGFELSRLELYGGGAEES